MTHRTMDSVRSSKGKNRRTPRSADEDANAARRTIATPGVEDLRILAADGSVDRDLDPHLDDDELLRIHRAMVLTRVFDQRMLTMQRQGQMGTFAPGAGQEATQIGQVYPLTERDWFSPSYRSFGAQIWRGWEMERLMLLWDGFFEGFAPPPGVRDLPFSIVIGSHVLPAVGVAMGMQYREEDSVMVTNFGDGALSQGVVAEGLNFAAVNQAPIVFVCENNGWAISTRVEQQCHVDPLALRGVGFGVPSIRVDGNDVLAMIVATREAIERARHGGGPTFIEAVTYRMGVHTTADDPKVYRTDDEVEAWEDRCPLRRFGIYLLGRNVTDQAGLERIQQECEAEVLAARDRFRSRAHAKPREAFDFVFADMPDELARQRQAYLEKLDRKGVE
ncbi:MAG: thiamine pyrophosphate-dependent dehydrogenase E1 component subunit alpha [Phycisphaerales bacterium]|nr:thiamine pyrophosphate-dependent dehydrogenase E1 component subunit alpha [Phycisphaerae bacterium]NNF42984.1 thiamine pyrophosphate-dependent dehydrogenase E1 component subunit alpha [Phycisphaerales bacterium]NNM27606.1 thiamine pyrophosphate-dependent dehydrogenase E1 component subunit alpha [Phycisphaerales bacterium]